MRHFTARIKLFVMGGSSWRKMGHELPLNAMEMNARCGQAREMLFFEQGVMFHVTRGAVHVSNASNQSQVHNMDIRVIVKVAQETAPSRTHPRLSVSLVYMNLKTKLVSPRSAISKTCGRVGSNAKLPTTNSSAYLRTPQDIIPRRLTVTTGGTFTCSGRSCSS